MAGIKTLHYIDKDSITSMNPYGEGWNIVLGNGKSWCRIQFSACKAETQDEGSMYRHTVEAAIPAKGGMSARDLMELQQGRYVVKVIDYNGNEWLVGDKACPMRLTVTDENGGTPDGETAYTLTFSGLSVWPQMILV